MWTDNTPKGIPGKPFNSSTIIISTADRNINIQIRDVLETSGYSPDIMNDDNIPMELVNIGLEKPMELIITKMFVSFLEYIGI